MTKSASRQKANNANDSKNATITSTANAPVNPADTKSTNKNPNVVQNANANTNKTANKNFGKIIALTDVTPASVQQARQIRKTDFERFQKFHNFFIANEEPTARVINSKANTKREQVDQWLAGAVNPKTLACIQEIQETQPGLLELLVVSAALTKYGEKELARRDDLGEMDYVVGARFGTNGLRSKQHVQHTVGMSFVLRLVLDLAPEKRAGCEILREILSHQSNGQLVLNPTANGLQSALLGAGTDSDDWSKHKQDQLRQMANQAQSDKFQEAMQQIGGEHLYDAIRTQLKQAGGASVWNAAKDKPALQAKNIRSREGSADKNTKSKKGADHKQQKQPAKKNGTSQVQSVKKHLPVEVEKVMLVPPPAPVVVKSATASTTKKEDGKKNSKKGKNAAPEKNVAPVKNTTTEKNVSTTAQKPGAIMSSARDGRAVISKAL
ncbi:Ribosomal RNA-processing protein 8 [Phytophthora nicotianae]|uniref:Ribosomal RNA-processing protein 8 n=1 Tax=Phytophthora nicotianae TaxID=4792 RepID=A0A0W8CXV5_PHYNI|nr:Ribosomal RNA-processing protein 8 [Phytophthora nicotianae]